MKHLILICVLISSFANARDYNYYVKIGTGYKIEEPKYDIVVFDNVEYKVARDYGSKATARFEIGVEKGNLTFGFSHHSQWLEGWPINNEPEYFKTELFVDYKFYVSGN